MNTLTELVQWLRENGRDSVSVAELEDIISHSSGSDEETSENVSDDETAEALDLLYEIMSTHQRTYSKLEQKLIETGVMSGRCYISWHENKYYPGATVDNLREMGFEKFYEAFKSNWEDIKNFRKQIIKDKYTRESSHNTGDTK